MELRTAGNEAQIAACYAVMRELRQDLERTEFINQVKRQSSDGYRLSYLTDEDGSVVAVAGYRIGESLAWGSHVYVDDLVTSSNRRSQGYGRILLQKIRERAKNEGCEQLHLDCGTQRKDAHRFYQREGLTAVALHFAERL